MEFILVGNGSMGSRYSKYLAENICDKSEIYIIDNNPDMQKRLRDDGFPSYESLSKIPRIENCKYGIVANWGPDHLSTAEELIKNGCKRLIIEKPISNSLSELKSFKNKYGKDVFITVHHFFRYTNLFEFISQAEEKYNYGKPVGVRLSGGAVCLSTSGTHYLDLACKVLDSDPVSTSADLEIDYINPRDKSLAFVGGNASYRMNNGTFIHVSFTNKSSHTLKTEVVYRHGIIEIDARDDKFIFFKRTEKDLEKFGNIITRHGKNVKIAEEEFEFEDTVKYIIDNLIFGKSPIVPISIAERSLKMILGAIQSHKEGRKIDIQNVIDTGLRIS